MRRRDIPESEAVHYVLTRPQRRLVVCGSVLGLLASSVLLYLAQGKLPA